MTQPKALVDGGDTTVSVDLNASGTSEDQILDVSKVDEVSLQATAATWTTAEVTLQRGADKLTFVDLDPTVVLTAAGQTWRLDVREARYLSCNVTTVEGSASTATFDFAGRRGPPIFDYVLHSKPNTGRPGSRVYRADLDSPEWFFLES